jgi:uncharacterized DUF497 family protein
MSLRFEWNPEVVEKNRAKHGVEPEDVESALRNTDPAPYIRRVEDDKYLASAQVEDNGDYLFIVFRIPKPGLVRTRSARLMTDKEKREFRRRRAKKR